MPITRRHTILRSLAFPLAGAALALSAASATALPIGNGEDPPPPPPNQSPSASLKVSPKVALLSHELVLQAKGLQPEGVADLQGGDLVKFDASASTDPEDGPLTYDFDLDGDGLFELQDEGPKQSKRYYVTGTFTVKVRARDEGGKTSVDTDQLVVHAAPRARLAADQATPLVGQTVNYTSSASTADPAIVKREWDLDGDGTFETDTGTTPNAATSYGSPGPRTVKVRITDTYGETSVASLTTKVNQLPTASFTGGPALVGYLAKLDASGSGDDSAIVGYAWDLDGDGTFETDRGSSPVVDANFTKPGDATVRLRVTDDLGASAVVAKSILVGQVPAGDPLERFDGSNSTAASDRLAPSLKLGKSKLRLAKNGKVTIKLSCPATETRCTGTVKLRGKAKGSKSFATGRFSIAGGKSVNVRLRIPANKRAAIRRGSKLSAKAIIAVSDAAGNQGTSTKGILIGL